MSIMLGSDPARLLGETAPSSRFVVTETTHDQRPAWQIESMMNAGGTAVDPDVETQTETFVVDQATGLIVVSSVEWQGTPQERVRRSSELIDIEQVSEMPAGFPGEFPEGAQIDRSGDPNAFRPATLDEAATWFGPGFFAPAGVPAGTTIFLSEYEWESGNPESALNKSVQIAAREGFTTPWSIYLSKDEPGPSGATPDGQLLIDGTLCRDVRPGRNLRRAAGRRPGPRQPGIRRLLALRRTTDVGAGAERSSDRRHREFADRRPVDRRNSCCTMTGEPDRFTLDDRRLRATPHLAGAAVCSRFGRR